MWGEGYVHSLDFGNHFTMYHISKYHVLQPKHTIFICLSYFNKAGEKMKQLFMPHSNTMPKNINGINFWQINCMKRWIYNIKISKFLHQRYKM